MYRVGERVRWCSPLDADYSYGTIVSVHNNLAVVMGSGYYTGVTTEVHLRYVERAVRGGKGFGNHKKHSK